VTASHAKARNTWTIFIAHQDWPSNSRTYNPLCQSQLSAVEITRIIGMFYVNITVVIIRDRCSVKVHITQNIATAVKFFRSIDILLQM